jgi:hypothetical protein
LTSIFCTTSVIGGGDSAPDLPPPPPFSLEDCAAEVDVKEERFLVGLIGNGGLGMRNLRARLRERDGDEK